MAVDDVQWLDRASEDALAFAARRLADEPAAFLLARRPGPRSDLERALEAKALERVEVRPPSLGAIRSILSERLGLTLPRHVLRRLYDATLGNPLFVLELGRKVMDDGVPAIGEDLPVPDDVEELLGTRVAGLPDAVRHVLLAVALSPTLRVGQLASLAEPDALDRRGRRGRARGRRRPRPCVASVARRRGGASVTGRPSGASSIATSPASSPRASCARAISPWPRRSRTRSSPPPWPPRRRARRDAARRRPRSSWRSTRCA